jgi:hypothetical protein
MPSATIKGLTTIKWGTAGRLTAGAFTNAVVMRATFTPKNGEPIEIEDNDGFAKALVLLDDGFNATVEVLFDTAITWPAVGDTVALKRPNPNAEAALNCLCASIEQASERKKETTLSMRLVYRPGVVLT